eukprot:SAG31_NODE_44462_length_262_cov_1.552147_1_plen_77_part_01
MPGVPCDGSFWGSGVAQRLKPDVVVVVLLLRRLQARYPRELWHLNAPSSFQEAWVAYTRSFEEVIAEWDTGELGTVL